MYLSTAIVSGCLGLVGSETVKRLCEEGLIVYGIDNDSRKNFFGESGSTISMLDELLELKNFRYLQADIRNSDAITTFFQEIPGIDVVVHCAALPAHDTCDKNPVLSFEVNVKGTLNILESCRIYAPTALLIYTSSSKVYGCRHNKLPFIELEKRYDLPVGHELYDGIPETWNPDADDRSFLGTSKLAADVYCQQYALTYGLRTAIFRPCTLTGPSHRGTTEHGYLSYLTRCAIFDKTYNIFGWKGKCVRDVWHVSDMVNAFMCVINDRSTSDALSIYNIGGSRFSNCSTLEAIDIIEKYLGRPFKKEYVDTTRKADHLWHIGSEKKFLNRYPDYKWNHTLEDTIVQMLDQWQYEKVQL